MKAGWWRAVSFAVCLGVLAGCVSEPAHPSSAEPNRHLAWSLPVGAGQGVVTWSTWVRPTSSAATFGFVAHAAIETGALAHEGRGFALAAAFFENMSDRGKPVDRVHLPGATASVGLPFRETLGAWMDGQPLAGPVTVKEYPNGWGRASSSEASLGLSLPRPVKLVWSVAYTFPAVTRSPVARFWFNVTGDATIDANATTVALLGPTAAGIIRWGAYDGNGAGFDAGSYASASKSDGAHASFQTAGNTWISWVLQDAGTGRVDLSWRNNQGIGRALSKASPTTAGFWSWGYHSCRSEAWRVDLSHVSAGSVSFSLLYASLPVAEAAPLLGMPVDPDKDPDLNACNPFPGVLHGTTYSTMPGGPI